MTEISSNIKWILRLEGAAVLLLSCLVYFKLSADWLLFMWLFLIPDFTLLGYLISNKTGAVLYNLTHSLLGPAICLAIGLIFNNEISISIGLIWTAHVGFDRALGYGLKYTNGFRYTHLGKIGR
ncbi:DUF4260 domain-containing protein [Marinomonas sp. C2222]|uniref:DUF4260 domain-containing protein n=1 Tax=Marinomonas sargassi TaxID=2984494 RepID=A0ABT2YUI6_9GAMM|nr:DUF4260 domain-containing protein [Marinomonas sargassi]MCV2403558.1 DUF4260 domain-containing protein [Marinomonas sargassi]